MKHLLSPFFCLVLLAFYLAPAGINQRVQNPEATYTKQVQHYIDTAWDYTLEENDSALIFAEKGLELSKQHNYTLGIAMALESKGLYHEIVTGNYDLASKHYFEGIGICEENNLAYASSLYHSLGVMFHTSDNYEKALEYYTIAYKGALKDDDAILQKKCLINIGSIHSSLQNYEKAETSMLKSLAIEARHDLDYNVYANLGNLYLRQEKYHEAIPYLEKSVTIHPDNLDSEKNLMYLIEAKAALRDSTGMQSKINRAITEAENITALREKSNLYQALSAYFYEFEDYKTAMDYHKKYHSIYEEIKSKQRDQTVYDLETNYQTVKKERQLEAKKASEKLLIIILVSLGIVVLMLTYFYNKNRKKNRILAKQKTLLENTVEEKNMLLREIHHRVKNNLQVISSLLSLQQRQITDDSASQAIQEGRDRVKAMALIHQNLYQDTELIGVETSDYVNKLANSLIKNYKVEDKAIDLRLDIDPKKLDIDTVIPLGLVVNELISNALKYAFSEKASGQVDIKLKSSGNMLSLSVADNGKGLPKNFSIDETTTLGFRLIKAFSEKLKADLTVDSSEKGTTVSLVFPNVKNTKNE
ncbi:histidine kinase dimerization/phosphoacceptor domain -containing protein [Aequorivita sp. KMM 9714]|uniref:histidine kinase dimerization/phosphoacceptor domain -containing protein n=1 Tax=Aequorivita sp. KMM 9714 TaxID=2707173 RepID=UPI0013EE2887|nr:histidine kinase dimerization/phosphoacceptor domain -containing protein [Aequorivita sp. KMM 9714]NGX85060.1 tetratricopeptide repeat protein [Aequorivita sp. KMM 9714]